MPDGKSSSPRTKSRLLDADFIMYMLLLVAMHLFAGMKIIAACEPYFIGEKALPGLEEGWLFGRKQDKADVQYHTWKDKLDTFVPVAILFVAVSRTVKAFTTSIDIRCGCYALFGIAFLVYAHQAHAMFPLLWMASNFLVSRLVGGIPSVGPAVIWSFNCGVILYNDMHKPLMPSHLLSALARYDGASGEVAWDFTQLLMLLKTISYSVDYHWHIMSVSGQLAQGPENGKANSEELKDALLRDHKEKDSTQSPVTAKALAFDLWWGGFGPSEYRAM